LTLRLQKQKFDSFLSKIIWKENNLDFWSFMNILNFGDCIKNGNYKLHSKFENVHNYINNKQLVSLVSTKVGTGPNNIVIENFPQHAEQTLRVTNTNISMGNNALNIGYIEPTLIQNIYISNIDKLISHIDILVNDLANKISPKSLGFLLFPKNEVFFQTIFEKAFLDHVRNTCQRITLEKLPVIAKNMRGVGFGLTPSGDDFNCGILYALNYLNKINSYDFSELIEECYSNSIGNNLISNTFLEYAYSNKFYENFHQLLIFLRHNNIRLISQFANNIIGSGHTSGSDMLTGFIVTIKGVLNDKKHC